jgi:excisionase family DNA binding protein
MPTISRPDDRDLLTGQQVIERLLSDRKLRRVAATCVLPAVRCGTEWRFRRSDLDDWIQRQLVTCSRRGSG